jgi:nicotine blue oxidoreductase
VVGAVVLAAGEASRFGAPKQRVTLPDVLRALDATEIDAVVVVEGAHTLDVDPGRVTLSHCAEWVRGPGASLRCGLAALPADVSAAVVVLADGPDLAPAAVARVLARHRETREPVVAASYGGARGHPVVLARAVWDTVPDEGMRALPATLVPCDDVGHPGDVDTPDDLPERLR